MRRLILSAALVVCLASPVYGDGHSMSPTPKSVEAAQSGIPPHNLALAFLSAAEATSERFTSSVKLFLALRITVKVTIHEPSGRTETFNIGTSNEFTRFVSKFLRLKETYKKTIMRRGFKQLALSYDATVSSGCSDRWLTSGEVAVQQNAFVFELLQTGKTLLGAMVEDTITVILPFSIGEPLKPPLVLMGRYGRSIELRDTQSRCTITLRARP